MTFPLYDESTAPAAARDDLATTRDELGLIPNLERTMAAAPALLKAYNAAWALFEDSGLDPVERQVVHLTASVENGCDYCVPWHSYLAREAGMDDATLSALRAGKALKSPRLEALRRFTRALLRTHGQVTAAERDAFFAAGYRPSQALDVVLGIAVKLMSNTTNALAGIPLDPEVESLRWTPPPADT